MNGAASAALELVGAITWPGLLRGVNVGTPTTVTRQRDFLRQARPVTTSRACAFHRGHAPDPALCRAPLLSLPARRGQRAAGAESAAARREGARRLLLQRAAGRGPRVLPAVFATRAGRGVTA